MSLLRKVETYLRSSGTSASTFGRRVARDPRLVQDMRNHREVGAKLRARIEAELERGQ